MSHGSTNVKPENHERDAAGRGFPERMAQIVAKCGGTPELAQKSGLSEGVIRKYLNGKSDPSRERLIAMAEAANVSISWLATGDEETPRHIRALDHMIGDNAVLPDGWATFPVYRVAASAGHGAFPAPDEEHSYHLATENRWFVKKVNVNPANIAGVFVTGDSMAPTFSDGDIVLVDLSRRELDTEGVYVFLVGEALLVKRLTLKVDGTILLRPDNPIYEVEEIDPRRDDVRVYGRVVAAFKHF